MAPPSAADTTTTATDWAGSIAVGTGMPSVVRIPVPGTRGLFIELSPRGHVPSSGSTSTLFIQDSTGKRHLRLDYGYNKNTGRFDYHWNQKGTFQELGIKDHTTGGAAEEALYNGAKIFRYAGRALLVIGAAVDIYSIVVARNRWRQVTRVVAGWAGAWAGAEGGGALGAAGGTFVEPGLGTAIGGLGGGIVGSVAGYFGASWAAGHVYDWVEETYFEPLPAESAPQLVPEDQAPPELQFQPGAPR